MKYQLIIDRYSIPTAESFREPIIEDEFDVEMAKTEEDKHLARNARASKMWKMLRIVSKNKLNLLDKIDDGNNLKALFDDPDDENNIQKHGGNEEGSVREEGRENPLNHGISPNLGMDQTMAQEAV